MQPKVDSTTSKLASSNGSASASPSTHSTSRPSACAEARASSSSFGDQVEPGHPSAGARDRQRRVAGPAGDVEDLVADRRPDALDDPLADIEDQLGDRAEVAGRPHRPLTLLDLVSQLSVHAPTAP